MNEEALDVRLAHICDRLANIELSSAETHKVLETLTSRVGAQNHRLDKVEWEQQLAKATAALAKDADDRMWRNVRWTVVTVFMAAGVVSGIFFGAVNLLSQ